MKFEPAAISCPRLLRGLITVAFVMLATVARAQEFSTAVTPVVTFPHLKHDPGVTYPEQALRKRAFQTVTVSLILEIDASGVVRKATVTEPHDLGFDEAAVQAAMQLSFEPATRGGSPVASRIMFRYEFRPPPPRLVGRVASQVTDQPIAGADVVVRDSNGIEHRVNTGAEGSWTLSDLPPGAVHVTVTAPERVQRQVDEHLSPGEVTNVVLRLEALPLAPPAGATGESSDSSETADLEVTVKGERPPREVTKRTLSTEEIAHIPGTNGDALRSLQSMPGVALPRAFNGQLIVRGSAPRDTNIFVDGTNIPIVYHFGGLSSVIPTELLDKIDFFPGNYSAQYGRGMGGMVNVGLRDPKQDGLHGLAQADLIDTRLLLEGPLAYGWTFLAAGRRSWFDVWLKPVLQRSGSADVSVAPRYYDYQLMARKDLNSHSSLRLLFFGSNDALDIVSSTSGGGGGFLLNGPTGGGNSAGGELTSYTNFWRLQARYENQLSAATELRITGAYGTDSIYETQGENLASGASHPLSGRAELSQKVMHGVTANIGVDIVYEPYNLNLQLPPRTEPGVPPGGPSQTPIQSQGSGSLSLPGAYAEFELMPWKGARLLPGLRADYDSATKHWDWAPRFTIRQDLTNGFPQTTIKAGAGLFYQPPTLLETDPNYGETGLVSNRSVQYDIGLEQEFTRQINLSTDVFYKTFNQLVVAGSGNSGVGFAYGVEWLLRYQPDAHFFGWLSYTLSRSERRTLPGEPYYLFQYDQTHILTVLGSYKLGRNWQLGGRFRLVSGNPYTPRVEGAYDATAGVQQGIAAFPPFGSRLPLFEQLDVRVDKTWDFRTWKFSTYLDVENIYNAKNPVAVTNNYNFTQSASVNGLPILPILGIRGEF